ncbi:hypothetical protein EV379_3107 [Microterricola gilva]|uniref:Uncharacterized protein n=1 Tax=Microterricola gilva TaxID=393267 RepID=A0A4Q8AR90_9MICO|nr:hypothetical protein [Microterricola gilva]RZU66741.1 hypothetical protein EV379_3107 [Microterricola gilva]
MDTQFLPLSVRRGLYLVALAAAVAAPFVAIAAPEYAPPVVTASSILAAAAVGTALANPSGRKSGAHASE